MKSKVHPSASVTDFGDPRSLTFFASFRATASSSSAANGVEEQGWKRQVISESEARSHPGGGPRQRRSSFAVRSSGFGGQQSCERDAKQLARLRDPRIRASRKSRKKEFTLFCDDSQFQRGSSITKNGLQVVGFA
jgi:hypothetical protein